MTVEENLQVIDRADEAFNAQDWDRYFELFSESVVYTVREASSPSRGGQRFVSFTRSISLPFRTSAPKQNAASARAPGSAGNTSLRGPTRHPSRDRAARRFPLRISLSDFRAATCPRSRADRLRKHATTPTCSG